MAEAVFRQMVQERGLAQRIEIDSAGLSDWHVGARPHRGTLEVLTTHGIAHESIRSRQIQRADLRNFDYIVAMDDENMQGLQRLGAELGSKVFRLLDLVAEVPDKNVPDPYYSGNFEQVYQLVNVGCQRLLEKIIQQIEHTT